VENFVYLELLKNKKIFSDEIKTYNKINGSEIDFIYIYKE
jgi:predicted AAA+ superfamily ATPase